MRNTKKKFLSILLTVLLVFNVLPNSIALQAQSVELENARQELSKKSFIVPKFGEDKNILDMLKSWLETKGHSGIDLSIKDESDVDSNSEIAKINQDGSLDYFYVDPSSNMGLANLGLRNFDLTVTLSKDGEELKANPIRVQLKWDEEKVRAFISEDSIANFDFSEAISPNTSTSEVTKDFKLPYYANGKHSVIEWTSSDETAVQIGAKETEYVNGSFQQFFPITVKQSDVEKKVELKANYVFNRGNSNPESLSVEESYNIVVPAIDLTEIKSEMQADLDAYFNEHILNYFDPHRDKVVDIDNVLYDIQLPMARDIKKDTLDDDGNVLSKGIKDLYKKYITSGKGFSFYSMQNREADRDELGIKLNSYRGKINQPSAGDRPIETDFTMTLTHKEYDLSVSKTITLTINPVKEEDLSNTLSHYSELMDLVEANFFDVINSSTTREEHNVDAEHIITSLSSFAEVRYKNPDDAADNSLEYIYNAGQVIGDGVTLTPIKGWEVQESWRNIKSSHPRYLSNEFLHYNQPEFDTEVVLEAVLTVPALKQYKDYYKDSPDSEEAKLLESLLYRPITQTVLLPGKNGPAETEVDKINASLIIEGSKILEDKSEHDSAHSIWLEENLEIKKNTSIVEFVRTVLETNDLVTSFKMSSFGWLESIEVSGHEINTTASTNGKSSSWMWYVKGKDAEDFSLVASLDPKDDEAYVNDGDIIKLKFINDPRYPSNIRTVEPTSDIELGDEMLDSWTGFRGNARNNKSVRELESIPNYLREEIWDSFSDIEDDWGFAATISDLLEIDGKIYYASSNKLIRLSETGEIDKTLELAGSIGYFSRLAAEYGIIIIPLEDGAVQAVNAETLESLWVLESLDSLEKWSEKADNSGEWEQNFYPIQSLGTTYIEDGVAYVPSTAINGLNTAGGILRAIDMSTGKELWQYVDYSAGFYWGGASKVGDYLLIANDAGFLTAIYKQTGQKKTEIKVANSGVRSTVIMEDDKLYFTSKDGLLHQVEFDAESAKFGEVKSVKFAQSTSSTPSIFEGKAYVGGLAGEGKWGDPGVFAVIDLETMSLTYTKDDLKAEVKSAPLVLNSPEGVFVYFTDNSIDGLLYAYHDEAVEIAYRPNSKQAQFTTATPIVDQVGTVYYSLDSGAVVALKASTKSELNPFELIVKSNLGELSYSFVEEPLLKQNSSFIINDFTANVEMLFADILEAKLGDVEYLAFNTRFDGELDMDQEISVNLHLAEGKLDLLEEQKYKFYELKDDELIPLDITGDEIVFRQKLEDSKIYILAAVAVESESTETSGNLENDDKLITLSFDLNGGNYEGLENPLVLKVKYGTELIIPDAPVKVGFEFLYWKGSEYLPGDKYIAVEDHVFEAQWKAEAELLPTDSSNTESDSTLEFETAITDEADLSETVMSETEIVTSSSATNELKDSDEAVSKTGETVIILPVMLIMLSAVGLSLKKRRLNFDD